MGDLCDPLVLLLPMCVTTGRKGKLEVVPTKLVGTKEDLSVAYSPGVAEPCLSIQQNEKYAYEYTAKGHLGERGVREARRVGKG